MALRAHSAAIAPRNGASSLQMGIFGLGWGELAVSFLPSGHLSLLGLWGLTSQTSGAVAASRCRAVVFLFWQQMSPVVWGVDGMQVWDASARAMSLA